MDTDRIRAQVLTISAELLGVNAVREEDDFFELGGDSLLAMRLVGELRRATGRPIAVATLMRHPQFNEFCAAVAQTEVLTPDTSSPTRDPIAELRAFAARRAGGSPAS